MWEAAAVSGWLLALAGGYLAYRYRPRRQTRPPRILRHVELRTAEGHTESLRWVVNPSPVEMVRPHGRGSVSVYKRVGDDGARWVYQASE